ncbi:MAG: DUF1552 domain-containing protein [Myxococcota bacterium]
MGKPRIPKLNRRAFLRGAGAITIALPALELTHGDLWAAGDSGCKRFLVYAALGGTIHNRSRSGGAYSGMRKESGLDLWRPLDEGELLMPGPLIAGNAISDALRDQMNLSADDQAVHSAPILDDYVSDLLLLRGIDNRAGGEASHGGGHRTSNVTTLSAHDFADDPDRPVRHSPGDLYPGTKGPSIDRVLARRLSERYPTPFETVDLTFGGGGYGTPVHGFVPEGKEFAPPVSSESDPVAAFNSLFEGVNPSQEPDPELLRARAAKASVLDGAAQGLNLYMQDLSSADRQAVERHLESVRTLERRLDGLGTPPASCAPPMLGSIDEDSGTELIAPILIDIAVQSIACNLTNVATVVVGDLLTGWLPKPMDQVRGHSLAKRQRDVGQDGPSYNRRGDFYNEMLYNRRWRMEMFARMVEGLAQIPEGDGRLLDNCLALHISEFSEAANHCVRDLPILLAGSAGGYFRTGRHLNYNRAAAADPNTLDYDTDASTHNLFTSILQAFDYDDAHFGNDAASFRGPLSGLT